MARQTAAVSRPRATSSRTTAPKARAPKIDVDLDARLADEIDEDDTEVPTKTIKLLGETFTLRCRVNEYLLNAALGNDLEAVNRFFESLMSPVDYRRFKDVMAKHENMTQERFAKIFGFILEAVSERPTK